MDESKSELSEHPHLWGRLVAFTKKHHVLGALLTFPGVFLGLAVAGATIWPVLSHDTIPEFAAKAGWDFMTLDRLHVISYLSIALGAYVLLIAVLFRPKKVSNATKSIPPQNPSPATSISSVNQIGDNIVGNVFTGPVLNIRKEDGPYLFVSLKIEPSDKGGAWFRIQVKNGNQELKNVRLRTSAAGFTHIDYGHPIVARMLAPNGKFSELLWLAPITVTKHERIDVEIFYNCNDREYFSSHVFLIQPEDMRAQEIDPDRSNYKEGSLEAPGKEVSHQWVKPQGGMILILPEVSNRDEPNLVTFGNAMRKFEFNPMSRTVKFETKTKAGRLVFIELEMLKNDKAMHVVSISWNEGGGELRVNGKGRKDYDEAFNPDDKPTTTPPSSKLDTGAPPQLPAS